MVESLKSHQPSVRTVCRSFRLQSTDFVLMVFNYRFAICSYFGRLRVRGRRPGRFFCAGFPEPLRFDIVLLLEATMSYEAEELEAQIYSIFHPEPVIGNEGPEFYEMPPLQRLKDEYGVDTSYWKPHEYGSISRLMRRAAVKDDVDLAEVVKAQQVPREQFFGTLRLFGDAILAYQGKEERSGPYRFYPAILVSACASFGAYVRIYSELFVRTAKHLPATISDALLEIDSFLDAQ